MRTAIHVLEWAGVAVLAYVAVVGIAVTAGVLYASWVRRGARGAMDDAQVLAFGERRDSFWELLRGLMIGSMCQAFALVLQGLRTLRLLRMPADRGAGTPVIVLPGYSENAGNLWWLGRRLRRAGFNALLVDFPS